MNELIDRQAAIDAIVQCTNCGDEDTLREYVLKHSLDNGWTGGILEALDAVKDSPPAQPEPHEGYWIDKGWNGDWAWQIDGRGNCWRVIECSECGKRVLVESNYCPNCGAKMKGERQK